MKGTRKKLIEVALPLPEINDASAYDKMPGIGPHPKGIHHWWARLPLPAARAILFASVVDDPSSDPGTYPSESAQTEERERLFSITRRLMAKRLHDSPQAYEEARAEMLKHTGGNLPIVFDPFSGGGSIPLEAVRLGLHAQAADLNPVAVLLNKCNLELAPKWVGRPAVNPSDRERLGGGHWSGTSGLSNDVKYYGHLVENRARAAIGHLYPSVQLPKAHGSRQAEVIAWTWARTVASPNPAARGKHVPLLSTFWLSTKKGRETWIHPIVDKAAGTYRFEIRTGIPDDRQSVDAGTKRGRAKFACLLTDVPIDDAHIKAEGKAGRLGMRLVAIVADLGRGRVFLPANPEHEAVATSVAAPSGEVDEALADDPRNIWCVGYGLDTFAKLFTARQLTGMVTLSDLIKASAEDVRADAITAGFLPHDAIAYSQTITTFLSLALGRCADFNNSLCRWKPSGEQSMQLFSRQAIPMVWDFVEPNLLGTKAVAWHTAVDICADAITAIASRPGATGVARQLDAASGANGLSGLLVSTDPPYYDNISYAGLSDFFYVWLRRSLGSVYPDLFSTVLVPKIAELTASPERFAGDKGRAKQHFEDGFRSAFTALSTKLDPRFPLTVYYAYKQTDEEGTDDASDDESASVASTGWETLLEALISSGFSITATWPIRASQQWRMRALGSNALASYIVLACRQRDLAAATVSRGDFQRALRDEIPSALRALQQGGIAPVDLAQAAIGPGMSVFSRYKSVIEPDGTALSVRAALQIINRVLDSFLAEGDPELDSETRFALTWFDSNGWGGGAYGDAETVAKARNISVGLVAEAGIVESGGGKVRLLRRAELPAEWDPGRDRRATVWESTQHLIKRLDEQGEVAAAALLKSIAGRASATRDLAYRLYSVCGRKGWAEDARAYNGLVLAWPELEALAASLPNDGREQLTLDGNLDRPHKRRSPRKVPNS